MNIDSWVEKQLITYTARSYYILQYRYTIIPVSGEILSVGLSHTVFLKKMAFNKMLQINIQVIDLLWCSEWKKLF